jgi:hypothetical protein
MTPVDLSPPRQAAKRSREESPEPHPVSKIAHSAIAAATAAVPDPNAPLSNDGWDEEEVEPLTQAEVQQLLIDMTYDPRHFAVAFITKEKAEAFVKYIEQNNAIHDIATYRKNYLDKYSWYRIDFALRPVAKQQRKTFMDVIDLLSSPDLLSKKANESGQFSYQPRSLEPGEEAFK